MGESKVVPNPAIVLKRNVFSRGFGWCATKGPCDGKCWSFADGELTLDLTKVPELSGTGTAIRIEGPALPKRVLIVHGDDDAFHAFHNCCTHGKRRLDPVPGAGTVQCCSMGISTYDYNGQIFERPDQGNIEVFEVEVQGEKLVVRVK